MRLICINKIEDFDQLRNLKGKEYLYIKIGNFYLGNPMNAIDLADFEGTLDISFESCKTLTRMHILTPNNKDNYAFFVHPGKTNIIVNEQDNVFYQYHVISKLISIHNENELQAVVAHYHQDNMSIELVNNLILTNPIVIPKGLRIIGHHKMIYIPQKDDEKNYANILDAEIVKYDSYIKIKNKDELAYLGDIANGNVVVSIHNNIDNFDMSGIYLKEFYGNLYIEGNGHSLGHGFIHSYQNYNGLITELMEGSSLRIANLGLNQIDYLGDSYYTGGFLGSHFDEHAKQHMYPGNVTIINCPVINCHFDTAEYGVGIYVGHEDRQTNIYRSYVENNRVSLKIINAIYGTD